MHCCCADPLHPRFTHRPSLNPILSPSLECGIGVDGPQPRDGTFVEPAPLRPLDIMCLSLLNRWLEKRCDNQPRCYLFVALETHPLPRDESGVLGERPITTTPCLDRLYLCNVYLSGIGPAPWKPWNLHERHCWLDPYPRTVPTLEPKQKGRKWHDRDLNPLLYCAKTSRWSCRGLMRAGAHLFADADFGGRTVTRRVIVKRTAVRRFTRLRMKHDSGGPSTTNRTEASTQTPLDERLKILSRYYLRE